MNITKVGSVLTVLALAGAARAVDNYWWGKVSSDVTNVSNWAWGNAFDKTAGVRFQASDVANPSYGGANGSYTVDFKDNVVTGKWSTVACSNAFSYNPIVWTGTTGGLYLTEKFYVGNGNEGALDIKGGNHYAADNLLVGQTDNNGKGWLNIGANATLTTPKTLYMAADASNEGAVTNAGHLAVGSVLSLAKAESTKAELVNSGTLTVGGNTELGYGDGSTAGITNRGSIAAHWFCLSGVNGQARFTQDSGVLTVAEWLCVGSTSANTTYDALFQVNGGSVSNTVNNITIGSDGTTSSKAVLEVNGGEVCVTSTAKDQGNIYVNERRYADCELRVNGGRVHAKGKIVQNLKEQSNKSSIVVTGGELSCDGDFLPGNNGDSTFILSNGVVRCGYWIPTARTAKSATVMRIYDGELSAGYRNGSVQSTDGVLDLCCKAGSSALYEQFGGVANFTYDGDAIRMGVASGTKTDLRILGGTMNVTGKINLGYATQTTNTLTIATNALVRMGGVSSVNTTDDDTANNNLYLDGGVLQANATSSIGGKFNIYVKAGGVTLDTTNYCVTVANDLQSDAAEGETDGGLVKIGKGILTLTGATTYNGLTDVREGVLAVNAGHAFAGDVKIGAKGAIAVAIDSTTLAVNDEITLFTTPSLTFEDDADSIATSVFLTGNVIGYTLSSTTENGVTTVKATVTDITNISTTRKVTSFVGGPAADDVIGTQYYVDQPSAWSNGYPEDGKYDVAIFPGDAHMLIWASTTPTYNNKAAGDFVIRGGRVTVVRTNAAKWPIIGARHIAGNGTLCLQGVGLQSANTLVVDAGVTVDVGYPKLPSVAKDQDCWTDTSSETAPLTIDGAVVATNGFIHFRGYTTINGPITVGPYASGTSGVDRDNAHVVFNGTVTVLDGATFAFNNYSSSVTFGANAKLVLKGTGAISGVTGIVFPSIELGEDYNGIYGSMNAVSNSYILAGGTLHMTKDAAANATNVVLKSGTLVVDISGESSVAAGSTFTLSNVALADGASLDDLTFKFSGQNFKCTAAVDATTGTITVTTTDPDDNFDHWLGGAYGYWKDAVNWSSGVPDGTKTAVFDNDATVSLDAGKTVSNLVVNATVDFRTTNTGSVHPTLYIREVNGTGTIGLYHAGIIANGLPGTIASGLTINIDDCGTTDSWLEGDYEASPLLVYANIQGPGYLIFRDYVRLYGNNGGHTGKMLYTGSNEGRWFMTPESGFPNSSSVELNGSSYFDFTSGTIGFNNLKQTENGNYHDFNVLNGAAITIQLTGSSSIGANMSYHENKSTSGDFTGGWNDGTANCAVLVTGEGATLTTSMANAYQLKVEDGATATFAANNTAAVITVTDATIATTANRTIGTVTFEEGSCLALNTNALITVTGDVDVSNLTVTYTDEQASALAASNYDGAKGFTLLSCADSGTVSGTPKSEELKCADTDYAWKALVENKALVFARKYVKPGLYIIIR